MYYTCLSYNALYLYHCINLSYRFIVAFLLTGMMSISVLSVIAAVVVLFLRHRENARVKAVEPDSRRQMADTADRVLLIGTCLVSGVFMLTMLVMMIS
jgi:1,4-dihydroxy-2-naphthoate octaprenyltransferase